MLRAAARLRSVPVRRLATSSTTRVVGVRREDKNQWERRTPLAPSHIRSLVDEGIPVLVQSSTRRVFSDLEFEKAGAKVVEDLSAADVIVGVKEVPIDQMLEGKTYMMFSHTHKGQPYNMPMLQAILDKNIRLVDYELLKDSQNQRLVRFGTFAGYAGFIDFLHGLGQRYLSLGYNTPFLNVGMTYTYRNLPSAKLAVEAIGMDIARWGLPNAFGPFIVVFTGDGYVSKGAQEIFEQLPHQYVKPSDLPALAASKDFDPKTVYGCVVRERDYIVPIQGGQLTDKKDYFNNPQKYTSNFHTTIAPYMSVLVNGIYWESQYPRLLTRDQTAQVAKLNPRFLGVADISCDVEGSLEFMTKVTSIEDPFYLYDPKKRSIASSLKGDGLLVMSIDNLPAEMARESSLFFGGALRDFVHELATVKNGSELSSTLKGAIIADQGKIAPPYESRLQAALAKHSRGVQVKSHAPRRVLLLGAGMVAQPVVDHLSAIADTHVTVASLNKSEAASLIARHTQTAKAVGLDVNDAEQMSNLIKENDIVISLVPATMHARVAALCIDHKKDMVTASYISPQMAALHQRALNAGVTILNEIGLDPGIDHLSAVKTINEVHAHGGKIRSFFSVCGGLPAPEASDNALGYKFSWSPRGVLSAGLNEAQYLVNGKPFQTARGDLFKHAKPISIGYAGFPLEYLPNRNSLQYVDLYGIPEASNVCRGTLRYQGFSNVMQVIKEIGLLSETTLPYLTPNTTPITWAELIAKLHPAGVSLDVIAKIMPHQPKEEHQRILTAIQSLGLLSSNAAVAQRSTPIDALCELMAKQLVYGEDERDMVIMQHQFEIEWSDKKREHRVATLIDYGQVGGYTSMAKTVGLPTAIATDLLLKGTGKHRGVIAPMTADLYEPILHQLEKANIRFREKINSIPS